MKDATDAEAWPLLGFLDRYTSETLKAIARRWIGKDSAKLRKDDLLRALPPVLRDPARVREIAKGLAPAERTLLGVLKQEGGSAPASAARVVFFLAEEKLAKGWQRYNDPFEDLVGKMVNGGLLLRRRSAIYEYDPFRREGGQLIADPRLLGFVEPPCIAALPMPFAANPGLRSTCPRRAGAVALDLIAIIEVIDQQGELLRTQSGNIRAGDLKRLEKRLGWGTAAPDGVDGIHDPIEFFLALLLSSDLLADDGAALRPREDAVAQLQAPPAILFPRLLSAYLRLRDWQEQPDNWSLDKSQVPAARYLLLEALRSAALAGTGFVEVGALCEALFVRVSDWFALSHGGHGVAVWMEGMDAQARAGAQRAAHQAAWEKGERPFFEAALRGPLAALGLVEIGAAKGAPLCVRLSDLGRAALLPTEAQPEPTAAPARAWVVQPTFEILAFLEHASAAQLSLLERYAERSERHAHTATYRLTAAALCLGLDRGGTIEQVIALLESGGSGALPQNVRVQLCDWAAQRSRITVHAAARILAFSSAAARDGALGKGIEGRPIGETFLLLSPAVSPQAMVAASARRIDYGTQPARCLVATPDGILSMSGPGDLLCGWQADRLAERTGPSSWQLTHKSVRACLSQGRSLEQIEAWLRDRVEPPIPMLLLLTLRGFAGALPPFSLGKVALLQCPSVTAAQALFHSAALAPHLRGTLGATQLLVDPASLAQVRKALAALGIEATDRFAGE